MVASRAATVKEWAPRRLSSARHPLLVQLRRAFHEGEPLPGGGCAVEGVRVVEEAVRSGVEIEALVAATSAEDKLKKIATEADGAPACYLVPDRIFRSLTDTRTPQGLAAAVRLPRRELKDCLARPQALVTVLVELQDPGNLGTILRALDAFGGAACLLTQRTVSPFNAKAVRASAGSLFRIPVFSQLEPEAILDACRAHAVRAVGLAPRADQPLHELNLKGPVAFFLGQEGAGLPAALISHLDAVAGIPLAPPPAGLAAGVDSLNTALAAGLALYEAARQRNFAG